MLATMKQIHRNKPPKTKPRLELQPSPAQLEKDKGGGSVNAKTQEQTQQFLSSLCLTKSLWLAAVGSAVVCRATCSRGG